MSFEPYTAIQKGGNARPQHCFRISINPAILKQQSSYNTNGPTASIFGFLVPTYICHCPSSIRWQRAVANRGHCHPCRPCRPCRLCRLHVPPLRFRCHRRSSSPECGESMARGGTLHERRCRCRVELRDQDLFRNSKGLQELSFRSQRI